MKCAVCTEFSGFVELSCWSMHSQLAGTLWSFGWSSLFCALSKFCYALLWSGRVAINRRKLIGTVYVQMLCVKCDECNCLYTSTFIRPLVCSRRPLVTVSVVYSASSLPITADLTVVYVPFDHCQRSHLATCWSTLTIQLPSQIAPYLSKCWVSIWK